MTRKNFMCRPKELGGRRCPQHTDPVKHEAYNARRRELYAESKKVSSSSNPLDLFPKMGAVIGALDESVRLTFLSDARKLTKSLMPDFDEEQWKDTEDVISPSNPKYINPTNHDALRYYTELGFITLRNHLEQNDEAPTENKDWHDRVVSAIDSAFEQADPPEEPRLLYRGMRIRQNHADKDSISKYVADNFPVGGVISQKNYMSTSLSPSVSTSFGDGFGGTPEERDSRSVLFQIVSKQGIALGKGTSDMGDREKEVLMPRNARFKVVSVDEGADFNYNIYGDTPVELKRTIIRLVDVSDED